MKLNNIILSASVVLISLCISSCQDMFQPELDNEFGSDRALINPLINLAFLTNAYTKVANNYDFTECATDDAVMNDPNSSFQQMINGSWSPIIDPTAVWSTSYEAIFNINKFLTLAPKTVFSWNSAVDDSLYRKRLTAEAYGLRGYFYFVLLKYYGGISTSGKMLGVPYINGVLDLNPSVWTNLMRSDYVSTVDSIAKDFSLAANNLPNSYIGTDKILGDKNINRLTSLIVNAFQAKLYLHVSSPKYNNGTYNIAYCDSAIKYSGKLINQIGGLAAINGTLKVTQFYTTDANQSSPDILWRYFQVGAATNATSMALTIEAKNYPPSLLGKGQVNPTQEFVNSFPCINGYPINSRSSNYSESSPYVNRDPRLDLCVIRDNGKLNTKTIITAKSDLKDGIENQGATRTGYYLKKLLRPDVSISNPIAGKTNVHPLVRYTEMYLIFAEAATAAHGADWKISYPYSARDIILAIRKRAGITGVSGVDSYAQNLLAGNFMDLIRNERRIELAFEGFRFWDLRRWGLDVNTPVNRAYIQTAGGVPSFQVMVDEPRNFTTFKYFGPIPNNEILKCPKIEQNRPD